jgi:hypothetical protein
VSVVGIKSALKEKQNKQLDKMAAKDAVKVKDDSPVKLFQEAFEQHWLDSADTSRSVETDGFHPSSLGVKYGDCMRRAVYLLQGVEKKSRLESRIMRVFANGHAVHHRLEASLKAMGGINFKDEVVIEYDNPPVRGHADGTLEWMGRKIVVEIKSCSDEVFFNRSKFKKPKDEHFAQVNLYAYILGYDTVWIIYENKNTQELMFFEKKADPEAAEKIIK